MALNSLERFVFEQSLRYPVLFRKLVRPQLYQRNHSDPELVHEAALKLLGDPVVIDTLNKHYSLLFKAPPELTIELAGRHIAPFGTAAGFDKNGDALEALSHVFGFQEPGTVVLYPRPGNPRPRVATDDAHEDLYNAQGFPSQGLDYFLANLTRYRNSTFRPRPSSIFVSICGLPPAEQHAVEFALKEMETLLTRIAPFADGFVWNPFSPNTAALSLLRKPEVFRETARLMWKHAEQKLRLVKMGPYEPDTAEATDSLKLVEAFLEGGGHGVVLVNTKAFPKDQVPVKTWGYPSAGRSGRFLKPYRLRAVRDIRQAFPQAVIIASGGISDGLDAYETFKAGATALEGYTPYTYHGYGLLAHIARGVAYHLQAEGYKNLEELQKQVRHGASLAAT
ncbi:MAG: hypothetical protein EXR67_06835 [Dehalococcoidia bacterium]|nr:hypothetical protein [Dehalococcoidia bacterium]